MDQWVKYIPHAKDWEFIQRTLHGIPARLYPALFCAYLASWRHVAMIEPVEHKKDNAGRRAANTIIRVSAEGIRNGNERTLATYSRMLTSGPKVNCSTCSKCSLDGICGISGNKAGDVCAEWKADFTK